MTRYRAFDRDEMIIGEIDATDDHEAVGWAASVGLRSVARIEAADGDNWRTIFKAERMRVASDSAVD